jgi:hypothetical protein
VVVCGAWLHQWSDASMGSLYLYVPLSALSRADRRVGGFPFGSDAHFTSHLWRASLDKWLAAVGRQVYREIRFTRALIGFEIDDDLHASAQEPGSIADRHIGYLVPRDDDLAYIPATR